MAGEVEECITHQSDNLPSGSISFGRFDLESLSWERRSSFSHNRYLEEVEKYSTPGSVTKKKEYFEAHFKKKALLHQVSVENQKETETKHPENITVDNDNVIEDFICHGNNEQVEVSWNDRDVPSISDELETVEPQKEEMSSVELNAGFPSFSSEKYTKLFNEPLVASVVTLQSHVGDNGVQLDEGNLCGTVEDRTMYANANSKRLAENRDASSKIRDTKKKNESIQMRSQNVSLKPSDTVEEKAGKSQFRAHLPTQQMPKHSRNGNSVSYGKLKKADKQNTPAKMEKRIPSKVSSPTSTENGNVKIMASRNMKAKLSSEIKRCFSTVLPDEEGVSAKKAEVMPRQVERRGSDVRQPVNRVKLISKADDRQTSAVFKLKSSERAEKRKDYYLKLEEKLQAKEAEKNEIQARTEEVKEAEMKQFRKSLNFKATPMPSFYHETATKASEGKKASPILAKATITQSKHTTPIQPSHEKSLPSPSSNQEIPLLCEPHGPTRLASPSVSSTADKVEGMETTNHHAKKPDGLKREEKGKFNSSQNQGNGMRKKGESKSRMRSGVVGKVKGIVGGNLAVHVAS